MQSEPHTGWSIGGCPWVRKVLPLQVVSGLGMSGPDSLRASAVDLERWFLFVNDC